MGLDWTIVDTDHSMRIGGYGSVQQLRLIAIKHTVKYMESLLEQPEKKKRKTKKEKKEGEIDLAAAIKVLKTWYDEAPPKAPTLTFGAKFDPMAMFAAMLPVKYGKIPAEGKDLPECLLDPELIALWDFVQHSDTDGSHHAKVVPDLATLFGHFSPFIEDKETKEWVDEITEFLELAVKEEKGIEYH